MRSPVHIELHREYRFEAAHRLPRLPSTHKCFRLHGHSFRFELMLAGEVDTATGFLIDFGDIDEVVEPVRARLDHYYLNEIEGLENPTSEVLSAWLWHELAPRLPLLQAVTVAETCDARCVYRGH
jgi:6-pyruvoyltetrahydropterin/6-carboxytetrahydropterin synthase